MPNANDIKKLLDELGEVKFKTDFGILSYIKNDGRYFYSINGVMVGFSEKQLAEIIKKLPPNVGIIGFVDK